MYFIIRAIFACVLAISMTASMAGAQGVARVISAEGGAVLDRAGGSTRLAAGMVLAERDRIRTSEQGRVAILFSDETRVAIGPRSDFVIRAVVMQSAKRASRFSVGTSGGNFRFLSGNSPKDAYEIATPTATMGIRGTVFDVSAYPQIGARVAIFEGEVLMCPNGGRCGIVRGRCTLAIADRRGNIGTAENSRQKKQILANQFPFIVNQRPLPREYRTRTGSCGNLKPFVKEVNAVILEEVPVEPPAAPPPAPPVVPPAPPPVEPPAAPPVEPPAPPPPPPPPSGEFPGQSGTDTPSIGKGNDVSQGQSGTGKGKGKGAENRNKNNSGAFSGRRK